MATQSSILAGKSHGQEPGRLQSMESQRVGRDLATKSPPKQDACIISLVMSVLRHIKKQRHYFANKGMSSQGYGFSSGDVWMWELDCEESWAPKNWCFWTVVLEKTLEISPGDQSWMFIGRTDDEAETPILWPPHVNSWLIGKDPDAGRDWGQEEEGMTEDEMAGWHHQLDGLEFG